MKQCEWKLQQQKRILFCIQNIDYKFHSSLSIQIQYFRDYFQLICSYSWTAQPTAPEMNSNFPAIFQWWLYNVA